MNKMSQNEDYIDNVEQKIAIQVVTFSVIVIVIILTLVSFIRIYSSKKELILKDMETEATLLETVILDNLNYSRYFINIIAKNIKKNPHDLKYIHQVLKNHFTDKNFNLLFGWRNHSWVDNNFMEVVTSRRGIIPNPRHVNFVKEISDNTHMDKNNWRKNIVFYANKNIEKGNSLKIIDNVIDSKKKQYIGSVVLSYDINTMIKSLNTRKTNKNLNFVVLNQKLQVIAQSKSSIKNVIDDSQELDPRLNDVIQNLKDNKLSYLDMLNGVNYFITALGDLPFILIVNIDNDIIRKDIIDGITQKFVEVCVFAFSCLFIIVSIYKRETLLRTKAEKATIAANNATKAKSNFLAFTAHEIRSPLGFILTGSEIMTKELMGKLPAKYKQYADGIRGNAQLILDFITDILDETQIIEGKFKIINSLNKISEIVDEVIKNNLARYNERVINIVSEIDDNIPLLICDKRRISQVFSNLISNSIKYSKDNTTIKITGEFNRDFLEIKIIDQGIGMDEEDIPIALSTYGTVHNIDYNPNSSYGLGLPIVKMLLDAHDATITIESERGKGTTITLNFPKYKLIHNTDE
jgi:signal transduction histidine kinase